MNEKMAELTHALLDDGAEQTLTITIKSRLVGRGNFHKTIFAPVLRGLLDPESGFDRTIAYGEYEIQADGRFIKKTNEFRPAMAFPDSWAKTAQENSDVPLTPHQQMFESLKNFVVLVEMTPQLNSVRQPLLRGLKKLASMESKLVDKTDKPNEWRQWAAYWLQVLKTRWTFAS